MLNENPRMTVTTQRKSSLVCIAVFTQYRDIATLRGKIEYVIVYCMTCTARWHIDKLQLAKVDGCRAVERRSALKDFREERM